MHFYSENIQHTVEIDLFTDCKPAFRLCEIIKQKFQIDSTSESSAFNFEVRKPEGQICVDDVICTDESGIFHCLWKTVSVPSIRCGTDMIGKVLSEIFTAYIFVAFFSVFTIKRAAFIAQKFNFIFLRLWEFIEFIVQLIQSEIRNDIFKITSVCFL